LVVLAQEEGEVPHCWDFEPASYGPFSVELARDVDSPIASGFIERQTVENRYNREKDVYRLTNKGVQAAKTMLQKSEYDGLFDESAAIKINRFTEMPIQELLRYVYASHETYTTAAELDTERVFDPEADSDSVKPDVEPETLNIDAYLSDPTVFQNDDGTWTARDEDLNCTAMGATRATARENLARVIAADRDEGGKEVTDDFLEERGVDPDVARDDEVEEVPGCRI
jgi:uncharacterized protein YwgA